MAEGKQFITSDDVMNVKGLYKVEPHKTYQIVDFQSFQNRPSEYEIHNQDTTLNDKIDILNNKIDKINQILKELMSYLQSYQ